MIEINVSLARLLVTGQYVTTNCTVPALLAHAQEAGAGKPLDLEVSRPVWVA